jgi:cytochrome c biogenesis protein CcdA/thiol-disulfide isomerase/thioredoxin
MPALVFAFVAGLLTVLAPCTLPVIPLVLGGAALGGRRRAIGIALGFGAAFITTAVLAAALLAGAGLTTGPLRTLSAVALGILGLALVVPVAVRWTEMRLAPMTELGSRLLPRPALGSSVTGRRSGLLGGLLIGVAIGLLWAPCVGPLMASTLVLAASEGPTAQGLAIAIAYVAGVAIPILAIGVGGQHAIARLGSTGRRLRAQQLLGATMVLVSALLLTGLDVPIESSVAGVLPADAEALLRGSPVETAAGGGSAAGTAAPGSEGSMSGSRAPLPDLGPAPELQGITAWINSSPLSLSSLRGKVVLVHFWTFGCINCRHVQPYVKAWWDRYAAEGLVVVGVHTPELSFERDLSNVRQAVQDEGVTFPVAFDPSFDTWHAYQNRYWPAFYFIDRSGRIRHTHAGEGDYATSEQVIRELLAEPG